MKNFCSFLLLILIVGCSKKKPQNADSENVYIEPKYDTVAIDSFSDGAVSVDIAQKIRISSVTYQDSLKQVLLLQQEEKKKKEEQEKLEKSTKEALEKEKDKSKTSSSENNSSTKTN